LICSQIVLNEKNVKINEWNDKIIYETKREKILESSLDNKNDLNYIINYAVSELGMVKEDLLQKYYILSDSEDRVEIPESKSVPAIDFTDILSAIFRR